MMVPVKLYTFRRLGPPHSVDELPWQTMLHPESAGAPFAISVTQTGSGPRVKSYTYIANSRHTALGSKFKACKWEVISLTSSDAGWHRHIAIDTYTG